MDAMYWILFSLLVLVLGLFPSIGTRLAAAVGFISPSNFVFLCMIFLLILRVFSLTIKVSVLEQKVVNLVQELAIRENNMSNNEISNEER